MSPEKSSQRVGLNRWDAKGELLVESPSPKGGSDGLPVKLRNIVVYNGGYTRRGGRVIRAR